MSSESNSLEETLPPRRLEVVSERVAPDRKRRSLERPQPEYDDLGPPLPAPEPAPTPTAPPMRVAQRDIRLAAAFEAISRVLAVRLFMLLAVAGAFALGWKVEGPWSAGVFGVFSVCVVLPMILLEYRVRP
jgi:hypothetical protein